MVRDGNSFIPEALRRGASAVLVEAGAEAAWRPFVTGRTAFVAAPDVRAAMAQAAAGHHGFPARSLGVAGVTGTDGKTTTSHLIAHVLATTAGGCGLLSSVEFAAGARRELNLSHMTTLEAPEVQRRLARSRDAGDRYAVVEASSIGLHLHRVDCCEFDVGVFTNLAQDHLDYHRTMEAYADAKAILFRMLDEPTTKSFARAAVLNAEDPASDVMRAATRAPVHTYALNADADVMARDLTSDEQGMSFTLRSRGESARVRTRLLGAYNAANSAAAAAVALTQGVRLHDAAAALSTFPGVPGRMEQIDGGQPFRVVVDIASTEQAMRNVLIVLAPVTRGRLVVLFGAAGERDRERRSGIARAVAERADFAVLANEDPRSEDPDAIIDDIARALIAQGWEEGTRFERIPDRRIAMARAFERAGPGDTVLLAGKATEPSIDVGTEHLPWDEREVARTLLRGSAGV